MTTTPLRPDLAHRATLGRWLRIQAEAITRPWINVVLARRVYRPEQTTPVDHGRGAAPVVRRA